MPRTFLQFAARSIGEVEFATSHVAELPLWDSEGAVEPIPLDTEVIVVSGEAMLPSAYLKKFKRLKAIDLIGAAVETVPNLPGLVLRWEDYKRFQRSLAPENIIGLQLPPDAVSLPKDLQRLPNLTRLNLKGCASRIKGIERLSKLEALDVSDSSLKALPDEIRGLGGLAVLKAHGNPLGRLPDWLGEVSSLRFLHLSSSRLTNSPEVISRLSNLRFLNLSDSGVTELPSWLFELSKLEVLWMAYSGIDCVPDAIQRLRNLNTLTLYGNRLTDLPQAFSHLHRLAALNLANNPLARIPEVVFSCRALVVLWLGGFDRGTAGGTIEEIPDDILRLDHLETLHISSQSIKRPPPEVVARGLEAIKSYFRQLGAGGPDYLCEAKLLIVGEPGAGKTSLARLLREPEGELTPGEPTTEGIEVTRWAFPIGVRVRDDEGERVLPRDLQVNVWDFGGQEIYHATHQFFLTRRSVYVLVADSRKEDTDFHYWLSVVELLSDNSPVLIVKNEREDRRRDIDETSLRARFGNLRPALTTNLATKRGLKEVRAAVRAELERLPHIGTALPATWRRVRDALERDPRNHITLDQYLAICEANGFAQREDALQLGGFLHDLGICLHFQDDPLLSKTVILKTRWGTDAVYRLLDHPRVLDRHGRFDRSDLAAIWHEPEYAGMRDELVHLMMKFELCYPVEGAAFIAPQLLEAKQPAYTWEPRENLLLKYSYDFMPKGIVTRFIVATHHLIEDQTHVWKGGVVLAREGARAEVVEDYPHRQITVRLAGTDRRELLAVIDYELDRIHRSFPRLRSGRLIPCNCHKCASASQPQFFPYDELRRFAWDGKPIQCRQSYEMIDASVLLDELFPRRTDRDHDDKIAEVEAAAQPVTPPAKQLYLSYAWGGASDAIADELGATFAAKGIPLARDRDEIRYKDSIGTFMRNLGRGKAVVVVLSQKYLKSKASMFELTQIARNGDLLKRVFPIVLDDANIYDAVSQLEYVKHWEGQKRQLNRAMKQVDADNLQGIRDEIDLYTEIRGTIAKLLKLLGDMNVLTAERHRASGFKQLIEAVEQKLAE